MTAAPDNVLDRLRKLINVQETKGSSIAEATFAAAAVQKLLIEHNLTLAEVETAAPVDGKREKRDSDRRAEKEYQRRLMATIARGAFCLHEVVERFRDHENPRAPVRVLNGVERRGRFEKRHLLVGRSVNVEGALALYDYVTESLHRLARAAGCPPGKRAGNDFLVGAVGSVVGRLEEKRQQAERESAARAAAAPAGNGSHRELVLVDVYGSEADLNNDFRNGYAPGTTAANRRRERAEHERRIAERRRLVAEGVPERVAYYVSWGYSADLAASMARAAARSSGRGGPRRGRSTGFTNADREHYRRINSGAYARGRAAGAELGLDPQVDGKSTPRIGR